MNSKNFLLPIILYLSCYLLSSCNLKPVYGNNIVATENSSLHSIEIAPINSVAGSALIHHLSSVLPNNRNTYKYLLAIKINHQTSPIAIQKNANILRNTISQLVEYKLSDKNDGSIITQGKFKHHTSYATTFTPYANYVEEEEALNNLSKQAAEDICTRLLLYFSKNANL